MIKLVLLQAATGSGGAGYMQFVMLAGMVAIFYFFFIRPQQKKQKEQRKFIDAVKKGDLVVTMGGIHGRVVSVEDSTVILDVDRGNKLVIEKSAISMDSSKRVAESSK